MSARKALFLIDAMFSFMFAILLLSVIMQELLIYRAYVYDAQMYNTARSLLITSTHALLNDAIVDSGNVCILRVYDGVRRVCGENT